MKMPDPMMAPMTTIVASNGPKARRKVTGAAYHSPGLGLEPGGPEPEKP
jgi:hypothetical protein